MGVGSLRLEFQVVDLPYMGARNHPWVLWEQVRLIKELPLQPMIVCVATAESVLGGLGSTTAGAGLTELNLEEKEKYPEGEMAYGDGVKRWC